MNRDACRIAVRRRPQRPGRELVNLLAAPYWGTHPKRGASGRRFPHNMKPSSLYPTAKLRDAQRLKEMGHVATLMDYSRFNYLVRPGDKIDPALLLPRISPFDTLEQFYGAASIQWQLELGHVLAIVGGCDTQNKPGDQAGGGVAALPMDRQARAIKLLNEQLLPRRTGCSSRPSSSGRVRRSRSLA